MSNHSLENSFLKALARCQSLVNCGRKPSDYPCEAINLLCEVANDSKTLIKLLNQYPLEVQEADKAVTNYASTVDNWTDKNCPLGTKDHCNILHFFLNLNGSYQDQLFFRGKDFTPRKICQFLLDWKEINLFSVLRMGIEKQFLTALNLCQSLINFQGQPSNIPCQAIESLFSLIKENYRNYDFFLYHNHKEIEKALKSIDEYAKSCDNWRIYDEKCSLGLGVKDHCTILSFLLNRSSQKFKNYTGNLDSAEVIWELLQNCKTFDSCSLLTSKSELISH
jgi:hypothetical protein